MWAERGRTMCWLFSWFDLEELLWAARKIKSSGHFGFIYPFWQHNNQDYLATQLCASRDSLFQDGGGRLPRKCRYGWGQDWKPSLEGFQSRNTTGIKLREVCDKGKVDWCLYNKRRKTSSSQEFWYTQFRHAVPVYSTDWTNLLEAAAALDRSVLSQKNLFWEAISTICKTLKNNAPECLQCLNWSWEKDIAELANVYSRWHWCHRRRWPMNYSAQASA